MASVCFESTSMERTFKTIIADSQFLGKGSFGEVYGPFAWQGKQCAIKRRVFDKRELNDQMQKEIYACSKWKSLNHRNLIMVFDAACDAHFNPPAMYIIMEFAKGGSLEEALKKLTSPLPIDVVKDWAKQVACGMAYLHSNSIVHRDLKTANIVISEDFDTNELRGKTLKITDFDCIKDHHRTVVMSLKGTITWMAPEVLSKQEFSKASDVWSYGVIIWSMITREETNTMQFDIPETAPDVFKYLMKNCMDREKANRPEFAIINDWFEKPEIVLNVVGTRNKSTIVKTPVDYTVDQLLAFVSDIFGLPKNATNIRLGFEDTSLERGSCLTIWQAGLRHLSTLVLIVRQDGGNIGRLLRDF